MGSLTGNNNSLTPTFQPGVPISANALNRLAQGYEMAKTTYSDGVLYTASCGGVSYSVIPQFIPAAPGSVQQFQVQVITTPSGGSGVQVATGRVLFQNAESIGTPGSIPTFEANVVGFYCYPTGKLTAGTGTYSTPWCNNDGYVSISPGP